MMALLSRIDLVLFRAEQRVVAVMLAAMGVFVFLDVATRVSVGAGSWLGNPLALGPVAAAVAVAAFYTRDADKPVPKGIATGVGVVVAQQAALWLFPNGLIWSQTLALAFTLWLGLLGAALAARERRHLALDIGSKLWPPALAPKMAALGHALTGAFCVGLLLLGLRSVGAHYDDWAGTDGAAGTFPVKMDLFGAELPIIKWVVFLAVPYGAASIGFRFLLDAVRAWRGELPTGEDDTLQQLGIEAPKEPTP